jgi:hemoglobin
MPTSDITSRKDIQTLIITFYERVKPDPIIGFIFTDVVKMDWPKHIPVIVDFWETVLLDNPVYTNNAMGVHYALNKKIPLTKDHFEKWVELFTATVDELFTGPVATLAVTRARSIAGLMQHKMNSPFA